MKIYAAVGIYDDDPSATTLIHAIDEGEWEVTTDDEFWRKVAEETPEGVTQTRMVILTAPAEALFAAFQPTPITIQIVEKIEDNP